MLAEWRAHPDRALLVDLSVRGHAALRRSLFAAARQWTPYARQYPVEFQQFCKAEKVTGKNELALVRLLFGSAVEDRRVSEYAMAVRYWHFDKPDATLETAEATRLNQITRRTKQVCKESDNRVDDDAYLLAPRPPDLEIRRKTALPAGPAIYISNTLEDGTIRLWRVEVPYAVRRKAALDLVASKRPADVIVIE
jgi:hypothetical protein